MMNRIKFKIKKSFRGLFHSNNSNRKFWGIILLLLLQGLAIDAQVISLDSVLSKIDRENPMLKMYSEQINAANNYAEGARSWMPSKFSTGPWQVPYKSFRDGMWMFSAEQMLPNKAKQTANYNYMLGMSSVEAQVQTARRNELFTRAKYAYYEWIVLNKKYVLLIETDSLLNYMIGLARLRYTYNKEKLSSIFTAEADLYELRNMETTMRNEMKMKNVELNILMNAGADFKFEIDTNISIHNYELQKPDTALILSARSDIKQYDASIHLTKLQQELERSKRLPDFGISISHMQSLGMMQNQFAAMGMVSIPIAPLSSREYKSNIKALENTSKAMAYQKESMLNETSGMIVTIQTQIQAAKQQIENYHNRIISAYYNSYQSSLMAYRENTESLFMVLNGLRMYRMAQMNELDQLNTLLKLQTTYENQLEIR
jgi:hypothetical protein